MIWTYSAASAQAVEAAAAAEKGTEEVEGEDQQEAYLMANKLQCTSKALVPPSQGCIDDVLTITTDSDKATIGVVLQGLGVQVTAA